MSQCVRDLRRPAERQREARNGLRMGYRFVQVLPQTEERGRETLERLEAGRRVVACLAGGLPERLLGGSQVVVEGPQSGEPRERKRALGPRWGLLEDVLEQPARAGGVARHERVARALDGAATRLPWVFGRCQAKGLVRQLGRGALRATGVRPVSGVIEARRNGCIGSGDRQGQVACSLLGIVDELRDACVDPTACSGAGCLIAPGREQRMREADALVLESDHVRLDSRPQTLGGIGLRHRPGQGQCRLCEGRGHRQRLARLGRQGFEPRADELAQVRGHGQRLTRGGGDAPPLERAGQLESEEGIPAGRLVQPAQNGAGERGTQPRAQQTMKIVDAERTDLQPAQTLLRQGTVERERDGGLPVGALRE